MSGWAGGRAAGGSRLKGDAIRRAGPGATQGTRRRPVEGRRRSVRPGLWHSSAGSAHILPTIASRRAMRFSIGGWVEKSFAMPPPPPNGLAIIMCAVVGCAVAIGMRWV